VRTLPLIAVAGLLAGCQKSQTFPTNGNATPVNEAAMPAPEVTPSETGTEASGSPSPAETPGTPPPSPVPPMGAPSPGA
jgi:hypothetical protein